MRSYIFLMLMTTLCAVQPAHGQVQRIFTNPNPLGANWYNSANWTSFVPTREFSEIGVIGSNLGSNRFAYVDTPRADTLFEGVTANPGEIRLGSEGGGTGNILEIRSGGSMHVEGVLGDLSDGGIEVGSPNGNGTLRVLPGGSLTVDGVVDVSNTALPNGPSTVVVGGTTGVVAKFNAFAARIAGVLQPYANSDVNFSNSMSFAAQGVFRPEIRKDSNAKVDVANVALLDGTLTVDFTEYTPTPGEAWTLIDAGDIQGVFDAINSPQLGLGATLTPSIVPSAGRERLNVAYSTSIVLMVDRDSGNVFLTNPNSPNILLDGYSIRSASSKLNPASWQSLDEHNLLGGDWRESNPAQTRLSELKQSGSGTFLGNNAGNIYLGAIYDPNSAPFSSGEDLIFDYTNEAGEVILGQIVYTGTRVSNLLLQVDPSGIAKLRNTSQTTVLIDGYDIASASGSLNTAGWTSLDDTNSAGSDWRESNVDQFQLAELKQAGATTLAPGASIDLGDLFTGGTQDLVFRFLQAGNSMPTIGAVLYQAITPDVPGDYNLDGSVDAADYTVWRDNFGREESLPNDDTPGVDHDDYARWKTNFGTVAGGGSGARANSSAAVPEPPALSLFAASLMAIGAGRTARTRHSV